MPTCLVQVELWPGGLSSIAPEALLVARQEVKGLNSVILSKVRHRLCVVCTTIACAVDKENRKHQHHPLSQEDAQCSARCLYSCLQR